MNISELNLPIEISTAEAAEALNVDKKTVLGYIRQGVLPARDASLPSSLRPLWKLLLDDVLEMRSSHQIQELVKSATGNRQMCRPVPRYEPKILKRRTK